MKKILVTLTKKEEVVAERVIAEFSVGKNLRVVSVYSAMSMDRTSLLQEIADTDGYLFGLESDRRRTLQRREEAESGL